MEIKPSGPRPPAPGPKDEGSAEVERACHDMEALFLKQLLTEMHRAGGNLIQGGPGAGIYQDLFDQELAQDLARRSEIGIARMLRQELGAQSAAAGGTHTGTPGATATPGTPFLRRHIPMAAPPPAATEPGALQTDPQPGMDHRS